MEKYYKVCQEITTLFPNAEKVTVMFKLPDEDIIENSKYIQNYTEGNVLQLDNQTKNSVQMIVSSLEIPSFNNIELKFIPCLEVKK